MSEADRTTERILVLVKTYPEISVKYTETVCVAGILADTKQLIRLYPIRYRYLEEVARFSKYQWIEGKLYKSPKDTRPESYRIEEGSIKLAEIIPPSSDWQEREKWVLHQKNIYHSVEDLLQAQQTVRTSLA